MNNQFRVTLYLQYLFFSAPLETLQQSTKIANSDSGNLDFHWVTPTLLLLALTFKHVLILQSRLYDNGWFQEFTISRNDLGWLLK
jgi:hypothetical protein